jgi:cytochrome c oxidase accessory protein FixG
MTGTLTSDEAALSEIHRRVYPRAVRGWFAKCRWALIFLTQTVFYGLPWLTWNGHQAVLLHLSMRKFYFFNLVIWPQDVTYISVLLVLCALSLFLLTAVAGRIWCGYACPQTIYTELFSWLERKIEGDRLARIRLDWAPLSLEKLVTKALKYIAWLVIALWTGYTFVGYFTPIHALGISAITRQLSPSESFWIFFYTTATYGCAGFLREQICKYMCPYARLQRVMFDEDTLVIAYERNRGEPRSSRPRALNPRTTEQGDCIDCNICVQACPTGIDIRRGLQYECIGCGACIDGCNQVMAKMGYSPGLIRYTTKNALALGYDGKAIFRRVFRPRTLVYTGLLLAIVGVTAASLEVNNPLRVDLIRDRGALAREAHRGVIDNDHPAQLISTD